MSLELEVQSIAEQLPEGTTRRGVCPQCHGGDKRESSFVVGREIDRIWYKCFRAHCGLSGIVGAANLPPAIREERHRALERMRPYTHPVYDLDRDDEAYFSERFEISPTSSMIGVSDRDEYVIPLRGPYGLVRGHVVRQPGWKGARKPPRQGRTHFVDDYGFLKPMPKTVLYPCSTQAMLAWYLAPTKHLVLVEDQISAMKIQEQGVSAVALLGNGLNVEGVRDILRVKPRVVTIALDPGAEGQAQNLAKKWGLYFERTRVVMLEADPKDILASDLLSELGL